MIRPDPLNISYPIRIRKITIYVMFVLSLIFYLFPRFLEENNNINYTIIEEIETKVCKETIQLNKQNFFITWLTDERYQNSVVMSFLFVLENL